MDGRDIVCIMPTGMNRGLSINYFTQYPRRWWEILDLPASGASDDRLHPRCFTSNIFNDRPDSPSPRGWRYVIMGKIFLGTYTITVPAAMITSGTPETEKKQTLQRLQILTERSMNRTEKEIKLIYVTVRICVRSFDALFMNLTA